MAEKKTILFLCTGNSCRSQMAEAWTRKIKNSVLEPYSAGVAPKGVDPLAVRAMAEAGIDIRNQTSKSVDDVADVPMDYVVTLCGKAQASCPVFPAKTRLMHVPFDDPPDLAKEARDGEEAMSHYRRVRDEIRSFVETLPESLEEEGDGMKGQ